MAKTKNSPLDDAFKALGLENADEGVTVTDIDNESTFTDPDVDDFNDDKEPDDTTVKTEDQTDSTGSNDKDDNIPQDVLDKINKKTSDDNSSSEQDLDDDTDVTPEETSQVGMFFDAFAEALNWDVNDDEKPKSVDELIGYISDVVEQNSKPNYADQRIAQLDEYVKNGGSFEDFYNNMSQTTVYDNMDLEDESNQKAVVREYMKLQGYSDEQINKKIERYEDADMLVEEAEDAFEILKATKQKQLEEEQQRQEQFRMEQQEQAKKFYTDLNSSISSLDNIRGIAVPKEDRKALLDYITRTDADGLTQYQKDFNKNVVTNLIESAYFTMKGDTLIDGAKRNGQTSAASKLRTMLRHQAKNHSAYNVKDDKQPQAWEIASKYL